MAPNKKKKKPVSNPARGFATTSIASKPKVYVSAQGSEPPLPNTDLPSANNDTSQNQISTVNSQSLKELEKELHELSPEQLERQLEESDLQLLLEKNGEKSKKDALRQVNRLRTERRTLRPQALHLHTRAWLSSELIRQLTNLLGNQPPDGSFPAELEDRRSSPCLSQDDLVIKMWTLKQVLRELGFSQERSNLALRQLLHEGRPGKSPNLNTSKDTIWGLEACLDWFAAVCEPRELPDYENFKTKDHSGRSGTLHFGDAITGSDTEKSTPTQSRSSTPVPFLEPSVDSNLVDHPLDHSSRNTETESDEDVEPVKLVEQYISLQQKLYRLQPDMVRRGIQKRKGLKSTARNNPTNIAASTPEVARIIRRVKKIQSDILFDQSEADDEWAAVQIDLIKEAAERKRLQLESTPALVNVKDNIESSENNSTPETASTFAPAEEDNMIMVGDLFSVLPNSSVDKSTPEPGTELDSTTVVVTDFGEWTGQSPRRIFEEACKARDSSCKVAYKSTSSSFFSYRQSVSVVWSRGQALPISPPITSVSCVADQHSARIEMMLISAATSIQAEAYVSTVALFLLFSSVPKEEKAYLRLPPIWRDLWTELSTTRKEQADATDRDILRDLRSLAIQYEPVAVDAIADIMAQSSRTGNGDTKSKGSSHTEASISIAQKPIDASEDLKAIWSSIKSSSSYGKMLNFRKKLPIWNFKDELIAAVEKNQVVIVCGETGCGKSTQVPVFILENELSIGRQCKVYCTEPRRISAISLARRVSEELGENKNAVGTSRSLVGYAIRLESHVTNETKLVYATTGIVMRMLERSEDLGDITHLVLDEVHERSIDSDFLLIVLRKLMAKRPALKVLLMSATVDAQRFSTYLDGAPIMTVPGRTFPVETRYLEDAIEVSKFNDLDLSSHGAQPEDIDDIEEVAVDAAGKQTAIDFLRNYSAKTRAIVAKVDEYRIGYDLIVKLLAMIATDNAYLSYSKAILVFLPGIAEIKRLNDMLLSHPAFSQGWDIYSLHSTIAMEEQEQAFLVPAHGVRKIVLATNIAETGITIPDVTCVVDSGKHKEMRFDERRQLSRLIESFISRANAKQRRGRAGRVQNGLCFHLFTKARHDNIMAEQQMPEMLRLSLQDLVLRIKICKLGGIEQTLSEALDPPSTKNIRRAIDSLVDVKALTATEDLTPLGRQLAKLPLDVFLGKLILLGSVFRTLDATLTIAAILSSKSPFSAPMGARSQADAARLAYKRGDSDLLTVYNAYCAWRRVCIANPSSEQQFCRKNFLSSLTLSNIEDLKAQLTSSLDDAGFLKLEARETSSYGTYSRSRRFVELHETFNLNNNDDLILGSVIAWSFYPKLLKRDGKGWKNVANNQVISLHPTSVNKGVQQPPAWLSFYHIMQSSNKFYNAHETTAVEDFAIALVCGDAEFKMYSGVIVIDGNRLRFSVDDWKTMLAIKTLRTNIRSIISQSSRYPGRQLSQQQQTWFDIWLKVFRQESKDKR